MGGEANEKVGTTVENSTIASKEEHLTSDKKLKEVSKKKKSKGVFSWMWNTFFGSGRGDFERRLERISKKEAIVLARMRRRAQNWGKMKRSLILFSALLEFIAVGYALMTARAAENWKIRAMRVLPMFLLPAVSSVAYSAFSSIINICERKDHKTLENLRTERKQKLDELKEKTNYYITQQLIQRYDTDPAAKAAAATVLASKLGAESGLKVKINASSGKSNDVEHAQSNGLRYRKQGQSRATSPGGKVQNCLESSSSLVGNEYVENKQQIFVDHYQPRGATAYNNGWFSRIAALLVGEDPTQCYALICGNCRSHNGLASKEDVPYVTYICPHCRAVNGPKTQQKQVSGSTVSTDQVNASISADNSPRVADISNPEVPHTEVPPLVSEETARHEEASTQGLASKEDFPYVTHICLHCRAVNWPKTQQKQVSGSTGSTDQVNASNSADNSQRGADISNPEVPHTEVPPLVSEQTARPEEASTQGLESKEDFLYVTYICPHCRLVNGPKTQQKQVSGSTVSTDQVNAINSADNSPPVADIINPEAPHTEVPPLVSEETARPEEASTQGNEN